MKTTTVDIDLAKHIFAVHGVNEYEEPVLGKSLKRDQVGLSTLICLFA